VIRAGHAPGTALAIGVALALAGACGGKGGSGATDAPAADTATDSMPAPDAATDSTVAPDVAATDAPGDSATDTPVEVSAPDSGTDVAADMRPDAGTDGAMDVAGGDRMPRPDGLPPVGTTDFCTRDGWCWANPLPQGLELMGVSALDRNDVWAVGQQGTVIHFDGQSWRRVDAGVTGWVEAVKAFAWNDVWAGGEDGVMHWDGTTWTHVDTGVFGWVIEIAGSAPDDLWVSSTSNEIAHYRGPVAGWAVTPSNTNAGYPSDLFSFAPDQAWAAGDSGYLRRWNGQTWSQPAQSPFETYSVWGATPDDVWLGGTMGAIYRWNGQTFARTQLDLPWLMNGLWGSSARDVWGLVNRSISFGVGEYRLARFDGAGWRIVDPGGGGYFRALDGSAADDIWIAGARGVLQHWNGASWSARQSAENDVLSAIWANSADDAWAVGWAGRAVRWNGSTWSAMQTPATVLWDVFGTATDDVWAIGDKTVRWNGTAWMEVDLGVSRDGSVWGSSRNDVWIGGNGPSLRHFDGAGFSNVARGAGQTFTVTGIWGFAANDVWIVGGSTEHWDGIRWTTITGANATELQDVWGSSSNDVWAVGLGGVINRWRGLGWTNVTSPTTEDLFAAWGVSADEVYAAGFNGTLLRWNGTTWTRQDAGAGNNALWPNRLQGLAGAGNRLWAAGDAGMILTKRR